jgi:hypothetical protein
MDRKIFDCFTFFNELELLDLRLSELFDEVDFFVLCESPITFTGKPKPLYFNENKQHFRKYLSKIIHVIADGFPDSPDPVVQEHFQREAIRRGLKNATQNDFIIITDVDELISPQAIKKIEGFDGFVQFDLNICTYYMNLIRGRSDWLPPFGFPWKDREKIPDFSFARWAKSEIIESFGGRSTELHDAGWHFTHLGGLDRIQLKFGAYSHANDRWPRAMMNKKALAQQILSGSGVGNTKDLGEFIPLDDTFPKKVLDRREYYQKIGFIKDIYEAFKELQIEYHALRKSYAIQTYDVDCPHLALGGLTPPEFLTMSGTDNPYEGKLFCLPPASGALISKGKRATQSSVCEYSVRLTVEEDAMGALDGDINPNYKFHTNLEFQPWWMVDLLNIYEVTEIRLFNRLLPNQPKDIVSYRSSRLKIEFSPDGSNFFEIFRKEDNSVFGGADGKPLIIKISKSLKARFIKLTLLDEQYFHLNQVEIYGE